MLLDSLRDLVRHSSNLGIETIKVTTDNSGNVTLDGVDNDKTIVFKGEFTNALTELVGEFGLSDLVYLSGFTNVYQEKNDYIEVKYEEKVFNIERKNKNGDLELDGDGKAIVDEVKESVVAELIFHRDKPKLKNPYRVVDKRMIPSQFRLPITKWDVEFKPTKASIDLLSQQAGIGYEDYFGVLTDSDTFYCTFGESTSQAVIEFANDIDGQMSKPWVWPLAKVLNILKFASNADCVMSFSDKGVLQITLDTGLGNYKYMLPARAK